MATNLQQIAQNVSQKEVLINQNFSAVAPAALFGRKNPLAVGLTFQYYGGNYPDSSGNVINISDGSITCATSATNYIEFDQTQKIVVSNTNGFVATNLPIATCSTNENNIISYTDYRIIPLIPYGSAGSGGGGSDSGSSNELFSLEGSNLSSYQNFDGKIKGGKIPRTSGTISDANYYIIEDTYVGIYPYGDTYVVFEIDQNGAKIAFYQSSDAYKNNALRKLLYIIRQDPSDSTKTQIVDVRNQQMYINRKTLINVQNYDSNNSLKSFDFSFLRGLQESSYGFFSQSMQNYPFIFTSEIKLRCLNSELGYNQGDETEYLTGKDTDSMSSAHKFYYEFCTFVVYQNDNVYVFDASDNTYKEATPGNWQIIVRIKLDI